MTKGKTKAHSTAAPKTARTEPEGTPNVRSGDQTELIAKEPVVTTASTRPRQTKAALLRAMLEAPGGASLTHIMAETGWQAHTVRAALTGLRKAGLHLVRRREGGDTIYAIAAAAKGTPDAAGDVNDVSGEPDAPLSGTDDNGSSPAASQLDAASAEANA